MPCNAKFEWLSVFSNSKVSPVSSNFFTVLAPLSLTCIRSIQDTLTTILFRRACQSNGTLSSRPLRILRALPTDLDPFGFEKTESNSNFVLHGIKFDQPTAVHRLLAGPNTSQEGVSSAHFGGFQAMPTCLVYRAGSLTWYLTFARGDSSM